MLCVVKRDDENSANWEVVHPVIFNNNPDDWSKYPKDEDGVGFVWNPLEGDPSHKIFNEKLKRELEKSHIC